MLNQITNDRIGTTLRTDKWWVEPLWTGLGFLSFVVYTTWAMFQGNHYWWSAGQEGFCGYLSPFYSPLLFIKEGVEGVAPLGHARFGSWPKWWPKLIVASSAILILAGPLSFRMTCYYYRKFYYREYFYHLLPVLCRGVPEKISR